MQIVGQVQELTDKLYEVLKRVKTSSHEDNPKGAIAEFLRTFAHVQGADVEVEGGYTDKDGSFRETDIMARGVAFEVKKDAKDLGTDRPNDAGTQINRRLDVFRAEGVGWATNGERWIRYVWQEGIKEDKIFNIISHPDNLITDDIRNLINTLASDLEPRTPPTGEAVVGIFEPLNRQVTTFAKKAQKHESYKIKFNLWQEQLLGAHMNIPQGEEGHDLFSRHTLLIAASRLIAAELSRDAPTDIVARITASGGFVTWLNWEGEEQDLRKEGKKVCSAIYQAVIHYDWGEAEEDILKHLYHDFIEKKIRHDFGEYYTPDWLAEMVTEKVLDEDYCKQALKAAFADEDLAGLGVLDPGCGSGTFLRAAARRLLFFAKDMGKSDLEISNAIAKLVYGFDIHPVAVELARATLLTTFLKKPSHPLQVFLGDALQTNIADSMHLYSREGLFLEIPDSSDTIIFPKKTLERDSFRFFIESIASSKARVNQIETFLKGQGVEGNEANDLRKAAKILQGLRDKNKNGIWEWFINNLAQPYRLGLSKVGRIIGNPPWITQKHLRNSRQEKLKSLALQLNIWEGRHYAPQNNLATLFVVRVIKLYLTGYEQQRKKGRFGFVLPDSTLKSKVWERFRNVDWGGANLSREPAWLVETTPRPFPQSACCVVFGESGDTKSLKKIFRMHGKIDNHGFEDIKIYNNIKSDFLPFVYNGATLFPHTLVRVNKKNIKKASEKTVFVKTCTGRQSPWKSLGQQEGELEKEDLRPALWGNSLLPFRILDLDCLIMPLELRLQEKNEARPYLTPYWLKADNFWKEHGTSNPPHTLLERINFNNGLSNQLAFLGKPLGDRVVYKNSGQYMTAAVINKNDQTIIDNQLFRVETKNIDEAYYLVAIINSVYLLPALCAARETDKHFTTFPFQKIPIKRYDSKNEYHQTLATLGKKAEQEAAAETINELQTIKSREQIRNALRASGTMQKIDQAVKAILPDYCD